ncbi:MAG: hypothetical protein V7L23_17270 [Nostoc sp.]|uniref:nSTAND1 domain-containing NTPase n=1 Tax=Nostoc sp. TaxID=1180 RepID=UPI002FF39EA4
MPNLETDNPGILYELPRESVISFDLSLYKYLLAQAQYQLGEFQDAVINLEAARDASSPIEDLHLHLDILSYLQRLYFEKKEYLKAYNTKQQQRSIEQQFGLRAFIGAGRLQSTKLALVPLSKTETQQSIAPEIAASGRLLDIERLIERLGRHDYKLIVIHGQSGVGKSSLVNAGLVPALKNKSVGIQDYLPVAIRVYTNWAEELGKLMQQALHERREGGDEQVLRFEVSALIAQLHENEQHNLRTVLIFDQFEEFFFVYTKPKQRQQFFEFLGECLNILSVKVILSLRVDYLHYLLECNRLSSMAIIGNDLLSNNVLYELGNFSLLDTKSIIQRLTETTSFQLEQALIEQLVNDLASELGEVRPIELQIVGAQLQTENITTLAKYQQRGKREELVKGYLAEVVKDCGVENQQIAEFLLYLLTDEKGTRPLKTHVELSRELQALTAELATSSANLDLVLEILVKSGLVILLPENPADRYQLVHDYIAVLVRQQQEPELNRLMAQLEQEKQQRKLSEEQRKLSEEQRKLGEVKLNSFLKRALFGSVAAGVVLAGLALTAWIQGNLAQEQKKQAQEQRNLAQSSEIKALANSSEVLFLSGQYFDALTQALNAGGNLKNTEVSKSNNIRMQTIVALREAIYLQPDENQFRERNRLEGHSGAVLGVSFSPDNQTIATASDDNTVKLWDRSGKELKTLKGHSGTVYSVSFSPDNQTIATASSDNTVKLWDRSGKELKTLKGHSGGVTSVSFSPDNQTIATASYDNTVKLWDLNLDNLLKDGCSWLNNYLAIHPDTLEELTVCQISEIKKQAASALVAQGEELARKGNIQAAVTKFHKAQEWDVNLKLDPTDPSKKAQQLADSSSLVVQGEELAQAGDLESAVVDFQKALKLDSKLEIVPREKAGSILIDKGTSLVIEEKFREALEAYSKAQAFDSKIKISAEKWGSLCVQGSLKRQANIVMPACDKAVALSPNNRNIQSLRGLARALTGDFKGAIADFEVYIAQTNNKNSKAQIQRYVKELRAGKNPFTYAELKKLRRK